MTWPEVRSILPNQWLVIEAVEAYTAEDDRRIICVMAVYECCVDGGVAWQSAHRLRRQFPGREFYPVHTSQLDFIQTKKKNKGSQRDRAKQSQEIGRVRILRGSS